MDKLGHIPLVEITRGEVIESVHYGSAAIVFGDSKSIFSFGDIHRLTYLRSSAKPFQTLAFLERGGGIKYQLTQREIAIISSSHSGTDEHVNVLETLQKKIGISEDNLQCGNHSPVHQDTAERMLLNNESLHPNRHNCSGKHTGMLAFAKMINAPIDSYLTQSHPVQIQILSTFAEMCTISPHKIMFGIDGCSAPVFAVPLLNAAKAYAMLCSPNTQSKERTDACRLITTSMSIYPEFVGGPERFDTDLMKISKGKLIAKEGAEGYLGIGVLPGASSVFNGSIGITIKISDGDQKQRAISIACLAILEQLGVLSIQELKELNKYYIRPVLNWREKNIGEIRPSREFLKSLKTIS